MNRLQCARWFGITAVIIGLSLAAVAGVHVLRGADPESDRIAVLRAAFDRASAECYATYRAVELQACLVGVMEAHLQALSVEDSDELDEVAPTGMNQRL